MTETPTTPGTFPDARPSGCPFDPATGYAQLRDTEGIAKVSTPAGVDAWIFSRYDDVRTVLTDARLSSRSAPSGHVIPGADLEREVEPGSIPQNDGERHTRIRRLLTSEFTYCGRWTTRWPSGRPCYRHPSRCPPRHHRGRSSDRRLVAHYLADGRPSAVLGWNVPREVRGERRLLTAI